MRSILGLRGMPPHAWQDALWGEILAIDWTFARWATIRLEIHDMDKPPIAITTRSWVGSGITPVVGQHVAIRRVIRGSVRTPDKSWKIRWDAEPQYAIAPPTQAELREAILPAYVNELVTANHQRALAALDADRAAGRIGEEEYERRRALLA